MKARFSWVCGILAASAGAAAAWGQGTTVQLPTYRTFQSGGAVVVPDRGSAFLGGVNRARSSRTEWGTPFLPFGNRAIGSDLGTSRAGVSVYIHDFAAMERELERAAKATPRPTDSAQAPARTRPTVTDFAAVPAPGPAEAPLASLEEIRLQRRLAAEARETEARDFLARGIAAEASGKLNVARMYYQIAAKRASGELQHEVLARLDVLRRRQAAEVARREP